MALSFPVVFIMDLLSMTNFQFGQWKNLPMQDRWQSCIRCKVIYFLIGQFFNAPFHTVTKTKWEYALYGFTRQCITVQYTNMWHLSFREMQFNMFTFSCFSTLANCPYVQAKLSGDFPIALDESSSSSCWPPLSIIKI